MFDAIVLATDTTNDPMSAGTNPATEKPSTNVDISQKTPAFTKNADRPNVIICIGRVRSVRIGLIVMLANPSKRATMSAK